MKKFGIALWYAGAVLNTVFVIISILFWNLAFGIASFALAIILAKTMDRIPLMNRDHYQMRELKKEISHQNAGMRK